MYSDLRQRITEVAASAIEEAVMKNKVREFKKTESANAELVGMLEELVGLAKAGKLLAYTMLGLNSNGEVFFNRHITDGRACILKLVGGLEMEKTMLLGEVEIE